MREVILLIDDEESILDLVPKILKKRGYETLTAANIEEAIGHLSNPEIALVVLDVMLGKEATVSICLPESNLTRYPHFRNHVYRHGI